MASPGNTITKSTRRLLFNRCQHAYRPKIVRDRGHLPLPDIRDEAIFHLGQILLISGQFCLQRAFLLHRASGNPSEEEQPQDEPIL